MLHTRTPDRLLLAGEALQLYTGRNGSNEAMDDGDDDDATFRAISILVNYETGQVRCSAYTCVEPMS